MTTSGGKKKLTSVKAGTVKSTKSKSISKAPSNNVLLTWGPMALLGITVLLVLILRLRLLQIPMERDEAGFAYIGHWLLRGKSLYIDMVDNKLPGLYSLYALFTTLFGYQSIGVHLGLLLANVVSSVCLYYLIRDLYTKNIAIFASTFFALLMISANVSGFAAHATQLLMPFVMGGWLLFFKGLRTEKKYLFLLSGLLLGSAFMIKQQSVVFSILAAILWWPARLAWNKSTDKKLPILEYVLLGIGGFIPVVVTLIYFSMTNRLDQLVFWTYSQPASMAATFNLTRWQLFASSFPKILKDFQLLWLLAGAGIIISFLSGQKKIAAWFGVLMFILGLGSVVIGAAFYNHYFVLALPGVALLAAVTLNYVQEKAGNSGAIISLIGAGVLVLWPVIKQTDYYLQPNYITIHQKIYNQMFPEIEKIGEELSRRVKEGDHIGVMGSEPGVLVSADRFGCSKHIFMYPMLSDPEKSPPLQKEFEVEIKNCMPEYIIWNTVSGSWTGGYEGLQMFRDLMIWIQENYTTTGIAEFRANAPGVIVWDADVQSLQSQSDQKVYVFQRKG
ncbi:MAG: glycosyltransferase family 39 protein [Bacteroidota bacterium]|nr:glycosyltransferase family 39 protein [Bacteroidota bacterium]